MDFDPPIRSTTQLNSIQHAVNNWINDFQQYSIFIQRLDTTEKSDFLAELRDYFDIREVMSMITQNMDSLYNDTQDYVRKFQEYSYLWQEDPQ